MTVNRSDLGLDQPSMDPIVGSQIQALASSIAAATSAIEGARAQLGIVAMMTGHQIDPQGKVTPLLQGPKTSISQDACDHPLGARQDSSSLGRERWTCRACGFTFDEPTQPHEEDS